MEVKHTLVIRDCDYDITKGDNDIAKLHIGVWTLSFSTNDDLAEFVIAVNELEIANDVFKADREKRDSNYDV